MESRKAVKRSMALFEPEHLIVSGEFLTTSMPMRSDLRPKLGPSDRSFVPQWKLS